MRVSSADGQEETLLYYDWKEATVTLDRSQSSINPGVKRSVETGRFPLHPDEPLELHAFLDHSVLKVYINSRGTLSSRI